MIANGRHLDPAIASGLAEGDPTSIARFTRHLAELRPALSAYLVTRTGGDPGAADDCLQEVALVLWKKQGADWSLEDFRRYAFRCADIEARSYRRKCHRQGKRIVYLSPDIIQALGNETQQQIAAEPAYCRRRLDSLQMCLDGLDPTQRELLDARYEKEGAGKNIADLARDRGCTLESLYKRLERIRTSLHACILKRLKEVNP